MCSLRDEVADLVFLDPPFNLGKDYGPRASLENSHRDEYDVYMRGVLDEAIRVLRPGGALFCYHLPEWALKWSSHIGSRLSFRHWIAVSMKGGFARGQRLYPAHYALLYYTKGEPAQFARPKLALRKCPHCGRVLKDYGGYREIVEQRGINLSDVWDDLSPVRHKSRKFRGQNQLTPEITERVCAIAGGAGCILVDPFVGTGTSILAAIKAGMLYVANDIEESNVQICLERLATLTEGMR